MTPGAAGWCRRRLGAGGGAAGVSSEVLAWSLERRETGTCSAVPHPPVPGGSAHPRGRLREEHTGEHLFPPTRARPPWGNARVGTCALRSRPGASPSLATTGQAGDIAVSFQTLGSVAAARGSTGGCRRTAPMAQTAEGAARHPGASVPKGATGPRPPPSEDEKPQRAERQGRGAGPRRQVGGASRPGPPHPAHRQVAALHPAALPARTLLFPPSSEQREGARQSAPSWAPAAASPGPASPGAVARSRPRHKAQGRPPCSSQNKGPRGSV